MCGMKLISADGHVILTTPSPFIIAISGEVYFNEQRNKRGKGLSSGDAESEIIETCDM